LVGVAIPCHPLVSSVSSFSAVFAGWPSSLLVGVVLGVISAPAFGQQEIL
jgi:hypothetical protein